jgi:hypothetical protein
VSAFAELLDEFTRDADAPPPQRPRLPAPAGWRARLAALFPRHVAAGFSDRHVEFWDHIQAIEPDARPRPFVGVWPRGGGKSTGCELATVDLGVRNVRRYAWYVRETQDMADGSVENIAALLESETVGLYYPEHADRMVGKFGNSKGWRRNRVRTAGGFTVDAVGLDKAARGSRVEDQRPDLIIFDDLDGKHDTADTTRKKIETLTTSLLPAGMETTAVLGVQNLIIPTGIFARLVDGRADFLADRIVSGPFPAVAGLKTEPSFDETLGRIRNRIVDGRATWTGQDLAACQRFVDTYGLSAFLQECQHAVEERDGALWTRARLDLTRRERVPELRRVVVAMDPSATKTGDEAGVIVAGLGVDGRGYVLADRSGHYSPDEWAVAAINARAEFDADRIVAEANNGGDMIETLLRTKDKRVPYKKVHASRGKRTRAEPVAALYEQASVSHVGTFGDLETELVTWVPGDDSPNRLDALVWALTELMLGGGAAPALRSLE